MQTTHRLLHGDARSLDGVEDESVELVVTSPPYPMVEMWDETFAAMKPGVVDALDTGDGQAAFELMHTALDAAWNACARVLVDGGIACINVGDATRSLDGSFRIYPNHARILDGLTSAGLVPLPGLLWRKPTNTAAKFMGSGMLPPNAYPTLEHEHLLVCRKGDSPRSFRPGDQRRYASAYFWEERNAWFSDLWTDVKGADQTLDRGAERERSAAYPLEIPFRLITMFSVYGDTVLDPFVGTGTTSLAAVLSARNSIGVDTDAELVNGFDQLLERAQTRSRELVTARIAAHRQFVKSHRSDGGAFSYEATHYGFPVKTNQERDIEFYVAESVEVTARKATVTHDQFDPRSP